MLWLVLSIFTRIFSNSYLNVFQKLLTNKGEVPSVISFYTYSGLAFIGFLFCSHPVFNEKLLLNIILMGILGALGNYCIIKSLSCGELSSIAPINSYKPAAALVFGVFLLKEFPSIQAISGIFLVIAGSFLIADTKFFLSKACFYRILALIFSASEAVFIKKVIILSDISSSFLYWALAGLIFSVLFAVCSKHTLKLAKPNIKYELSLIVLTAVMQYSTNYVFSEMKVSYALALFQLSTILSVFLGINIFCENNLSKKLTGTVIMMLGAIIIILA